MIEADQLDEFVRAQTAAPVAVLARRSRPRDSKAALWQIAPEAAADYARLLYATLRRLDDAGCRLIVVEAPPPLPEWAAVRDRLGRAATPEPVTQSDVAATRAG